MSNGFGVALQWRVVSHLVAGETLACIQRLAQRHHRLYVQRGHDIGAGIVIASLQVDLWVQEVVNSEAALAILWTKRRADLRG